MAERRQFGNPKVLQFGDRTAGGPPADNGDCAQCEAMLSDALDGTLSAADLEMFDKHTANCDPCSQMLADARRGAAWLEMLRHPRPELFAALLDRILAQTSGIQTGGAQTGHVAGRGLQGGFSGASMPQPIAAFVPGHAQAAVYGNLAPFPVRVAAALRRSSFGQIAMQPRLAMTAAMAFFSIALTMNLTGLRLQDLRVSNLRPSALKRDFYSADARVVRYYEGLRVVYELESKVHDLQSESDNDAPGSQAAPQSAAPDSEGGPNEQPPAAQPAPDGPDGQSPAAQPEQRQRPAYSPPHKPAPNSGTSRRESTGRRVMLAAVVSAGDGLDNTNGLGNTIGDGLSDTLRDQAAEPMREGAAG